LITVDDAVSASLAPSVSFARVHGIVLAGAYPTPQCPLDRLSPRPLLPVAYQPLVSYGLRWMRDGGVAAATVCANSAARAIRGCLGDGSALGMSLVHQEDWTPRGPAGCVRDAAVVTDAGTFVVVDGTSVPLASFTALLDFHRVSEAAVTVVVGPGRHVGAEEGKAGLRPTGVYVFDRRILEHIPEEGFQDIKERLLPRLYEAGERVLTFAAERECPRVINPATYLALDGWAVERAASSASSVFPEFRVWDEALIHEGAVVHPSARLLGPVLLGPGTVVGAHATIVGPASFVAGATIGEGSVVSRSVLWRRCAIGVGAFVDRCLLTDGASVDAHKSLVSSVRVGHPTRGRSHTDGRPRRRILPWALPTPEPQPSGRL
jgi:mannose-1-phosphate guanylyltransferase